MLSFPCIYFTRLSLSPYYIPATLENTDFSNMQRAKFTDTECVSDLSTNPSVWYAFCGGRLLLCNCFHKFTISMLWNRHQQNFSRGIYNKIEILSSLKSSLSAPSPFRVRERLGASLVYFTFLQRYFFHIFLSSMC